MSDIGRLMLYRRSGESLLLICRGVTIEVKVKNITDETGGILRNVRLCVEAPEEVRIVRKETLGSPRCKK